MAELIPIISLDVTDPVLALALEEGQIVIATKTGIYRVKEEGKERPRLPRGKGSDGKMGHAGLNPEDDGRRAGYELPKP